jgi:DNA gyrase subunit B
LSAATTPTNGGYDARSITVLEGLEAVRRRPGMYIGTTGPRGLHHLVWEVVDNSVDEALAGRCSEITVTLLADGAIRVADDGSGIPVDLHEKEGRSALEVVLTVLHAGGKFDSQAYAVSGGLHGVGISVVNALSERLEAVVHRDGGVWRQTYQRGVPDGPIERIGDAADTGTTITFWPDAEIFVEGVRVSAETIARRLRDTAFLTAGLVLHLVDERTDRSADTIDPMLAVLPGRSAGPMEEDESGDGTRRQTFHAPNGLRDFVDHIRPPVPATVCTRRSTWRRRSRVPTGRSPSRSPSSGSTISTTRS